MPFPLLAAGGAAALVGTIFRYLFLAHLGAFILRAMAVIGLTFVTNEVIVEPLLLMVQSNAAGMPGQLAGWLDAFGIDNVISIVCSAYTLLATKKLFLGKAG